MRLTPELEESAAILAERRYTRANPPGTEFADLPEDDKIDLIELENYTLVEALQLALHALVPDDSDFDAAAAEFVSKDWESLTDDQRAAARAGARPILAAYLLAPTTNGRFDHEIDEGPAMDAAKAKMKELLDRRMYDVDFLVDIVINEIVPHTNMSSIQTFLMQRLLESEREARDSEQRMREALTSAEFDQHSCTGLRIRIDELRRRIGGQHGFLLIGCARCGRDMIATEPRNDIKNSAMEICGPCVIAMEGLGGRHDAVSR